MDGLNKLACYRREMEKLKAKGAFPWALPPGDEDFGVALIALDDVFDLPEEVRVYKAGNFANG